MSGYGGKYSVPNEHASMNLRVDTEERVVLRINSFLVLFWIAIQSLHQGSQNWSANFDFMAWLLFK